VGYGLADEVGGIRHWRGHVRWSAKCKSIREIKVVGQFEFLTYCVTN
jgi:hypothetical protein